ncbi:MAG: hypothetical protein AAGF12_20970 [Myxococcota bacterium]
MMRPSPLCVVISLAGCLALIGCATDPEPASTTEASLELGTGSWRFEPLDDGDTVELVRGAQGGWHVYVSVRMSVPEASPTFDLDDAMLVIESQRADDTEAPRELRTRAIFDPQDPEGRRSLVGWAYILAEPGCLVGEMLRLRVSVESGADVLSAERYVVVGGGDDPPATCEPR